MPTKYLDLDTDSTMTANSDYKIASQKAIKTALSSKQDILTAGTGINITNNIISMSETIPDVVSSVSSSSTNDDAVGAKLFYDTCGDIESVINIIRGI